MENNDFDELYYAARTGDLSKVRQLIDGGADINKFYGHARTPLIVALLHQQNEVAHYLIDKGADVNAAKGIDSTAVELALLNDDPEMMKILFRAGAVFDTTVKNFVLTMLCVTHANNLDGMRCLAGYGIDLNVNDEGVTCLITAAIEGHIKMVKMLLKLGADPVFTDETGKTAYDYAIKKSIRKILKKAIEPHGILVTRYRVFANSGNPVNKNDLITARGYFDGGSLAKRKDLIMLEDGKATDFFENLKYKRTPN
jgi:ankyrin repeat protein